ncbi:uncharacterized protein LOC121677115 isoform X6 [Arvicola amphibius]|uniref:uncharacterized protein LOC121677115 isoform X6 n=1 Tax=Arvicola amphibius TaxID=1047088 RepID=UPI001C0863CB|nr:uncharacterized protein LOC121677115 isoform X6 [Arvicola amphibius]XP_041910602.1 uncharacterized protein LOC121677115 isoform X6 [Arvicola amphibius]
MWKLFSASHNSQFFRAQPITAVKSRQQERIHNWKAKSLDVCTQLLFSISSVRGFKTWKWHCQQGLHRHPQAITWSPLRVKSAWKLGKEMRLQEAHITRAHQGSFLAPKTFLSSILCTASKDWAVHSTTCLKGDDDIHV